MSSPHLPNAFLGTSEFGAEVLRILASSEHRPALVVTPPDRPKGRGRKLAPPPAATVARELGLPVHQTASVNREESVRALRELAPRLACVCAFGQLIKEPLLSELPMLNVHPSLLPRWRGAAPIERAIMAGDRETGVCVMRLTAGLDSGPIALSERVEIGSQESYGELAPRLAELGGRLLVRALDLEAAGELEFREQGDEGVTYAEKIGAEDRRLDPAQPARELADAVRALTPHIGAFVELPGGERLGVRAARAVEGALAPGEVATRDGRVLVGCGEGVLAVEAVQPAGKRTMSAEEFLRGHEPPTAVETGQPERSA